MNMTMDTTLETDIFEFTTEEEEAESKALPPSPLYRRKDKEDLQRPAEQRRSTRRLVPPPSPPRAVEGNTPEDVEFSLFHGGSKPNRDTQNITKTRKPTNTHPAPLSSSSPPPVVQVTVHEQFSATYDDGVVPATSPEPQACQLEGTVHVQSVTDLSRHPFCIVIRDAQSHIDIWDDRPTGGGGGVAKDISAAVMVRKDQVATTTVPPYQSSSSLPYYYQSHKDRILRISLPSTSTKKQVQVARYICTTHVRPVPLLVKSRVQSSVSPGGIHVRVGFKLRANPTNTLPLQHIVIIVAIPPHVNGRSGRLSRQGGVWDELKRTVTWTIPQMIPGEALEIQAQFETIGTQMMDTSSVPPGSSRSSPPQGPTPTPKFPILVRCEYPTLLSGVTVPLDAAYQDAISKPVVVDLVQSARILHRKV
jgi:hypothetical protein